MRALKVIGIIALAVLVAAGVTLGAGYLSNKVNSDNLQAKLQPFYTPPDPLPAGKPGDIIRTEVWPEFTAALHDATVYRTLYITRTPNGNPAVSSGLLFVPTTPAPAGKRPVVAYAHGTSGFGDACAPSRDPASIAAMPWVQTMMNNGWILTSTDYTGLGTPGNPYFLVGQSEAEDVVNSVRVARNFPGSDAGDRYTVMGHSQGGHAALWTGELSHQLAPELKLLGVTASAPAAELMPLLVQQWNQPISWALGPDVLVSWPLVYPNLDVDAVTTPRGRSDYEKTAYECVTTTIVTGQIDSAAGIMPFAKNPQTVPSWLPPIKEQTPRPLPATLPVQVTQGVADGIVLPNTNALLQKKWCAAGSNLQMNWLGQITDGPEAKAINHQDTVLVGWPMMTLWMQQRFQNLPAASNCTVTPPVPPASDG